MASRRPIMGIRTGSLGEYRRGSKIKFLRLGFWPFLNPFGPTIGLLVATDGLGYVLSSSLPLALVILVPKTLSFWHFSKYFSKVVSMIFPMIVLECNQRSPGSSERSQEAPGRPQRGPRRPPEGPRSPLGGHRRAEKCHKTQG